MAVAAVVVHDDKLLEGCRDTVEFYCREQVCPESMVQLSSGLDTKGKRTNAQTLLHVCEYVEVFYLNDTGQLSNEADGWGKWVDGCGKRLGRQDPLDHT